MNRQTSQLYHEIVRYLAMEQATRGSRANDISIPGMIVVPVGLLERVLVELRKVA